MNVWLERIKSFMDTHKEWHAFVIGLCEVIAFWQSKFLIPKLNYIEKEWHYYQFGRAMGVVIWIGLISWIKEIVL